MYLQIVSLRSILLVLLSIVLSVSAFSPERLICLVNQERVSRSMRPLVLSTELNEVCNRHSVMQAEYQSMTHDRYDHSPMDKAIKEHGLQWQQYGENVARGQTTEEEVFDVWMNSPPHRKNILNPKFTHMGVALGQPGYYWTQGFATLPGRYSGPVCP
ncbi:SCP-domain-containing protein [Basidiobolus meristosporus CBS 931.73]|uniref:SCP-domain-containing protein n=1 Tax=Basidiobolus meristosporus CBS 931.73 TaxID=1314790 RepID=A0A1Y1X0L0_9FUNG|nr:SCP-domain-containing protein [Basidiobolus meristosporus CBS 931.73]|eukprot:ORX79195.1 SCP-domain-containing protein [Basidiobolus meristosporus CBS 931.73]